METFDLAVIGAGPGGYSAALRGAALGLSVVIVEKTHIGGSCLNVGCVPAKSWVAAAETVDFAKHMASLAVEPFSYAVDFPKMAARQREIVSMFRKSVTTALEKRNVRIVRGSASFTSPNTIAVDGVGEIGFKNALIATGSEPIRIFDLDPGVLLDNTNFFDLQSAPKSLLIIGAGAIGCEMAGVFSRLGAAVTLVEMTPSILPMEDSEVADTLAREFRKRKINVITGVKVESLVKTDDGAVATLSNGTTITAEKVLVSAGRRFATSSLGLEKAGVKTGARGEILTDGHCRTSAQNIFAAGDVAGKYLLAYTAGSEGIKVAETIAGKNHALVEHIVPSVVFTIPEIGSVGVTERAAPECYKKGAFLFRALARAHAAGEIAGFVKIIADGATDKILGVHIIGPRATDMIHVASVAIAAGMTAERFGSLMFAHPTFAEALMEAAHDVHGASVHK